MTPEAAAPEPKSKLATARLHGEAVSPGAAEEIVEYTSDMVLCPRIPGWHHFQGNAQEDPYYDTMNDLVADLSGAICGAAFGVWYIQRLAKRGSPRLPKLVGEMHTMFGSHATGQKEARP